jgi:hypothetical protein
VYWFQQLHNGQTQAWVLGQFLTSPEFQMRYGAISNAAFIDLLYQNMLGRNPDPPGLAMWTDLLNRNRLTRAEVTHAFVTSPEFDLGTRNRAFANLLYLGFLRRAGDAAGLAFWTERLKTRPLEEVISAFITSSEYQLRF